MNRAFLRWWTKGRRRNRLCSALTKLMSGQSEAFGARFVRTAASHLFLRAASPRGRLKQSAKLPPSGLFRRLHQKTVPGRDNTAPIFRRFPIMQPETVPPVNDWLESLLNQDDEQSAPAAAVPAAVASNSQAGGLTAYQTAAAPQDTAFCLPIDRPEASAVESSPARPNAGRVEVLVPRYSIWLSSVGRGVLRPRLMIVTAICGVLAGGIWLMNRRGTADVAIKPAAHDEARPASTSNPSAQSIGEQHSNGEAQSDPAITPSQPPVQQSSNS